MNKETEEKLAKSLTAGSAEILPYLPYLLSDLWELGSNPADVIKAARDIGADSGWRALDLGCGKGAVSIRLAKELGCRAKGVDLMSEFIDYARDKAKEWEVGHLCEFEIGDINEAAQTEKGYDMVVLGAVGSVMGGPEETLKKLKSTVKPDGYIIVDDGYIIEGTDAPRLEADYYTREQWERAFKDAGLRLICEIKAGEETQSVNDSNTAAIASRAAELALMHPEHRALLEEYIVSQQEESDDMTDRVVSVMWVLKREERDGKA